jgi:FKBP-type peptidyl-prolyl cis-trans isomerase 2
MIIEKNKVVSIDYIMRNSKGDVLENTMNSGRTNYLHGSTGIHNYLQLQLEGLQAGDKKMVILPNEISMTGDDYSFEVIIQQVRLAMEAELQLGYPVMAECPEDCDCYHVSK